MRRSVIGAGLALLFGTGCVLANFVIGAPSRTHSLEISDQLAKNKSSHDAIARSLPYLEQSGRDWMDGKIPMQDGKGCVSCHYVNFAVWSHREAAHIGIEPDNHQVDRLADEASDFIDDPEHGRVVSWSHLMLASKRDASWKSDRHRTWASRIVEQQTNEGFWPAKGQFPTQARKVEESNAVATMWALAALVPYRDEDEVKPAIERALAWLDQSTERTSTEWLAWRLVIDSHYGSKETFSNRRDELLSQQNEDGGWSWLADNPSDAYTTGQVLYALAVTDSTATEPIERAVTFLNDAQRESGQWYVNSDWISAEPTRDKDAIYTYWGTAWAAIGLSLHSDSR